MIHMDYEYTRFGDGWLRRAEGSADEWEPIERERVPDSAIAKAMMPAFRSAEIAQGKHPDGNVQFARFVHRAPR